MKLVSKQTQKLRKKEYSLGKNSDSGNFNNNNKNGKCIKREIFQPRLPAEESASWNILMIQIRI